MTNRKRVIEAKKEGYSSAIELNIAEQIEEQGQEIRYEAIKIQWIDLSIRTYTPDFVLDNGIIIEVKGRWTAHDRKKHLEIRKQHPHLDIRMVFENSRKKLYKSSKTTYALWCAKKDILFADRVIPEAWLKEKRKVMPPKLTRVINHN
jgi:hypothetical protein